MDGLDARQPGRERPLRPEVARRLVAVRGHPEGADPVPGGDRRPARDPADGAVLQVHEARASEQPPSRWAPSAGRTPSSASSGSTTERRPELLELAHEIMHQGYDWTYHFRDFTPHAEAGARLPDAHARREQRAWRVKTPGVQYMLTGWHEHKEARRQGDRRCSTRTTARRPASSPATSTTPARTRPRARSSARWSSIMFSLENLIADARRPGVRRPARDARLQRATRHVHARHVGAPVRPAGQPGALHDRQAPVDATTATTSNIFGLEPNYGCCTAEHAPGLAEVRRQPVDGDARRGARGGGIRSVPGEGQGRAAVRMSPSTWRPTTRSTRPIKATVHLAKPAAFPLHFRIPGMGRGRERPHQRRGRPCRAGDFHDRSSASGKTATWSSLTFPMEVRGRAALQRLGDHQARPARLLAQDRRAMGEAPRATTRARTTRSIRRRRGTTACCSTPRSRRSRW